MFHNLYDIIKEFKRQSIYLNLSIYLSIYLPIYLYLSISFYKKSINQSINQSIYLSRYNLEQNDDDPLSEAVVEEIRHADAMDIIRSGG